MTAGLVDAYGKPMRSQKSERAVPVRRNLTATYDAAQTTVDNMRHWSNADRLSALAAVSPEVRCKLRSRARYEAQENNSYAKGIVLTLANDMVGTGPRLQLQIPNNPGASREIEKKVMLWTYSIRLAEKLRTARVAKAVDGEVLGVFVNNPKLKSRVQLDVELVEADRCHTSWMVDESPDNADGVIFDQFGNPKEYIIHEADYGPGSYVARGNYAWYSAVGDFERVPASDVVHLFRADRPGQRRGIPELTPALPLFSQLRRFTLATLAAAETAASWAAVLKSDAPPGDEDDIEPMDLISLEQRSLLTLPKGWDINQLRSEHPATTYEMFKRELLREIARCLNMPYNVAAGDSSSYNYASGRLDHQTYFRANKIEQDYFASVFLDPLLLRWLEEAMLIPGMLPPGLPPFELWDWVWFWDGNEHVDPLKEANAQKVRLAAGTTSRSYEYARQGFDVDAEDERAAKAYGVSVQEYRQALFRNTFNIKDAVAAPEVPVGG